MDKCYIIVLWENGIPYFYQTNNKVQWCFTHLIKAYSKQGSAINAVKKLAKRYKYEKICVYHMKYADCFSSSDFVQGKYNDNIVYITAK